MQIVPGQVQHFHGLQLLCYNKGLAGRSVNHGFGIMAEKSLRDVRRRVHRDHGLQLHHAVYASLCPETGQFYQQ